MTGHQAGLWHAGILAKYLAADALASSIAGAAWSHLVVDQDINDAGALPAPTADLRRVTLRLAPPWPGRVTSRQPASTRAGEIAPGMHPEVVARVERIMAMVSTTASAPDLPSQLETMVRTLTSPLFSLPRGVRATALASTDGFRVLLRAMRDDPVACVEHYNAAAASTPRARLAPLRTRGGGRELPLWRIDPAAGTRHAVFSDEVSDVPPELLAPRALLLSAFLRLFVCDLFIHGTGGGLYDQATDAWLGRWQPSWKPCPGAVVSATVTLPLAAEGAWPSPEAIARARWEAHAARHDPERLGDARAAAASEALLARIREAKAAGADARGAYLELHALLEGVRSRHRAALETLDAKATALEAAGQASRVVHDRTWPFALHSEATLLALRASIRRAIAATDGGVRSAARADRRA